MRRHGTRWLASILMVIMCFNIVVGSTFAYFTDEVKMTGNIIASGSLKAGLEYATEYKGAETQWTDASEGTVFNDKLWEPNFTSVRYIRISNKGNLAFQYELNVIPTQLIIGDANLMDVIDVYFGVLQENQVITKGNYTELQYMGTLTDLLGKENGAGFGILLPEKGAKDVTLPADATSVATGSVDCALVLHMQHTAGNEYMNCSVGDGFKLQLAATQYTWENDAFNNRYDADAKLPDVVVPTQMVVHVTPDANGLVPQDVQFVDATGHVTATVPAGAKMAPGATSLRLIIAPKAQSEADVSVAADEVLSAYEVCVEGLAEDNTVPVQISMGKVLATGLNIGNYSLYHVEDGATHKMTRVAAVDASSAHNSFSYDPATGDVSVAMATFSEVALVAELPKWEGKFDYSWYDADATELTIANADQLAAFGAIVGGMAKENADIYDKTIADPDSFSGKTVKLISDIDFDDAEGDGKIFYPIGYYNSDGTYAKTHTAITSGFKTFEGTFDGNGHTISNFYQNTWEMKGDHDWYKPEEQYYRDGMGLFGKVYGGTVKNLTVSNFSSDGEIATTGVIAAYADGATFENIAITNCNPRVYNIGNGGIVGCVGWYAKEENLKTTFTNITVDNSNKISALWGSYDVACGGIVGQYYPTSGQSSANYPVNAGIHFENCHVSAIMDVYNDVCANYQYYAYRYAGMIIGSIRENVTIDGHVYPKMDGITASGCTVNFGDWNDYYYCELVANSLASYTHDHQFSRLEQVASVDTENKTVTTLKGETKAIPSGRVNYVVVNGTHATENATCYHFVDGKEWNHAEAGSETVNGVEMLKENNQHIYLEFTNLFTGYGWGVTSKGLSDYEGVTTTGISINEGTQEESVEKFEKKDIFEIELDKPYKLSELFRVKSDLNEETALDEANITVTVVTSDATKYPFILEHETNGEGWEDNTITLTCSKEVEAGVKVVIRIQDYKFCTPTELELTVMDSTASVDKFEVAFDHDDAAEGNQNYVEKYLYRVGNMNTVKVGSLFEEIANPNLPVGNVTVAVIKYKGDAEGTVSEETDWRSRTIQFSGTGVVKVTIDDDNYANAVELYLEVVDAYNVTQYSELKNRNSVLLNDITISDNGTYYLSNATLYGNGFTFDVTAAKDGDTTNGYLGGNYAIALNNAILDNVQIIGEVYTQYGAQAKSMYNYPTILTNGNSIIANSYVSNCASPVRAQDGNLEIINSTLEGGIFANLDIRGGEVTLDNVITINQSNADALLLPMTKISLVWVLCSMNVM